MACKFNSGVGAHTCDVCGVIICEGRIRRTRYVSLIARGPQEHYLLTTAAYNTDPGTSYRYWYENYITPIGIAEWLHEREFCKECAALWEIENEGSLTTVEQVYRVLRV